MDVRSGESIIKIQGKEQFWSKGSNFKVYIDGKMVGNIGLNSIEEFHVEPGQHKSSIKVGWSKSSELIIQSEVGKTNTLICGFNGLVFNTIFVLVLISFLSAQILEPFHLGIQMEKRIDLYYYVIIIIIIVILSFLPSAMAYIRINESKE
jgi:hypothetical protein